MTDEQPEVVIVGSDGTEHIFPPGFDPKRAAAIVRGGSVAGPHPEARIGPASEQVDRPSWGSALATSALNALPGVGGIVGGALSTPETLGTGTIAGVALGAGAGRGLRDLLTEAFGLEKPTSVESKAGRIALDTGETAVLSAIIPGLIEAAKTPGKTIGELVDMLPARIRPAVPKLFEKAPAKWILQRPAWQTWQQPATDAAPAVDSTATGTSWQPAAMPKPVARPVVAEALAPVQAAPAPAPVQAAPTPAPAAATGPRLVAPDASAGYKPTVMSPTRASSEIAILLKRAKTTVSPAEFDAMKAAVLKGAEPAEVVRTLVTTRLSPVEQLAGSSSFAGLPSADDVAAAVAKRNTTGQWNVPTADAAAKWAAQRAKK